MSEEEIKQLIASNAKAIETLTNQAREVLPRVDTMARQFIDIQRRIDDNTAHIRELVLDNQRILRYLESTD